MKQFFFLLLFSLSSIFCHAQNGYEIKVKLDAFLGDTIFLGYHYGDKQYLKDTVGRGKNDLFVFKGDEPLEGGMYLIVMPPENNFIEVLIDEQNQILSIETSAVDIVPKMKIKGSKDNTAFYDYLKFIAKKRPEADALNKQKEAAKDDPNKIKALDEQLEKLNQEVQAYQQNLIDNYPDYLTTAIIKSTRNIEFPEFEGTEKEVEIARWMYAKEHYFDNVNLKDDRLVRTNFLYQKIDQYMKKMIVQHPDSLIKGIERIFDRTPKDGEIFKYYLIDFLNKYAKSKIVGMDAVYVHLAEKYYGGGYAEWSDSTQKAKIVENARVLKPLLIGKKAPNLVMEYQDGKKIQLYEVESPYTVLMFWAPDCGHCKKSAPDVVKFYKAFKDRGVKLFSVCSKFTKDIPSCWEFIKEHEFSDFINVVDPYHRSKYKIVYDIKSTPQVYILDKDKMIISKKISAEQLEEVMEEIMEYHKKTQP